MNRRLPIFWHTTLLVVSLISVTAAVAADPSAWGDWPDWGDHGDGTYRNPVVPADYSDIDCIRVESDYYAISSTFQFSPGMVILHSRDLVNWSIKGHAVSNLTQISPELNWNRMSRYGHGIWAGAIRHHADQFWIYFGTPDEGYFMTRAPKIEGPWEPLNHLLNEPGWDDCCPFWDDDGQGYLVGSNFRDRYKIHLWKLSQDGRELIRDSDKVIYQSRGSEANKLYKFNGIYYHFFSEVRPEGRVIMMQRSKKIFGPYEEKIQLKHVDRQANEPNQGGIVETPEGKWYFLTHHGRGSWEGRCVSLLPVTWTNGWPMVGSIENDGLGHMVWSGEKPLKGLPVAVPQSSDEFDTATLGQQWEWNYQPRAAKWSLVERPGWLRLHAFRPIKSNDLMTAGNTLTQRSFRTSTNQVTVRMDIGGMVDGQRAGLCHFAKSWSRLGVNQTGTNRLVEYSDSAEVIAGPAVKGTVIWLRSTWGLDGRSKYSFSLDGETYTDVGPVYQLSWGNYRGDRIGIFNFNDLLDEGVVDVDFFHYAFSEPYRTNVP